MSSETLQVSKRDALGSLACRKLRAEGLIPANLYGHGEDNMNLSVNAAAVTNLIKHGTKIVSLQGDVKDTALVREVQWDAFGIDVIHVDLTRVSKSEKVEVTLPVEIHGEAPGANAGGLLTVGVHDLTILCPANEVPEQIEVNVSALNVGDAIHASEITLPKGAELVTPGSEVVVQVAAPSGGAGDDEEGEAGAEPEVISKGKDEEEGE